MYHRKLINCIGGLNTYSINTINTIGNIFTTGGNVGIETNSPSCLLDVNGTVNSSLTIGVNVSSTNLTFTNTNILTNVISTNISCSNITTSSMISTNLSSVNITTINTRGTNSSISNIRTSIGSFSNCTITNLVSTSVSIPNISATNISSSNLNSVNLTVSGTISSGNFSGIIQPGTILIWSTNTIPSDYIECNGTAINRTTYNRLFSAIGTTYGSGDGSTTFNVPDLRGRVPVCLGTSSNFNSLGITGGSETHTLTINEMPNHDHGGTTSVSGSHTHSYDIPTGSNNNIMTAATGARVYATNQESTSQTQINHNHSLSNSGSGQAHNNMQPYIVFRFIIKT